MTPLELASWQSQIGVGVRAAARLLGIQTGLYRNWLRGRMPIPDGLDVQCAEIKRNLPPVKNQDERENVLSFKVSDEEKRRLDQWRSDHFDKLDDVVGMPGRSYALRAALALMFERDGTV